MNENKHIAPLVSVVMATYDGEKFIAQQLESICKQSYPHLEIIICDDCSTDNTKSIISSFASRDNRIQCFFNDKNIGFNKNFESGILKAKGDFICISDQDDIWVENKIEKLVSYFNDQEVTLVHGKSYSFRNRIPLLKEMKNKPSIMMSGSDCRKLFLRNSISGHNLMFRKSLIPHIISIPSDIYYDWWISIVASCVGKIEACPLTLTLHRHHSGNLTAKKRKAARQSMEECEERKKALRYFINIPTMNASARSLATTLLIELENLQYKKFSFNMFWLLMRNSRIFFYYKTKRIRLISFIKAAYRISQTV